MQKPWRSSFNHAWLWHFYHGQVLRKALGQKLAAWMKELHLEILRRSLKKGNLHRDPNFFGLGNALQSQKLAKIQNRSRTRVNHQCPQQGEKCHVSFHFHNVENNVSLSLNCCFSTQKMTVVTVEYSQLLSLGRVVDPGVSFKLSDDHSHYLYITSVPPYGESIPSLIRYNTWLTFQFTILQWVSQ